MAKHSLDPREWPSCPFWLEPWVPGLEIDWNEGYRKALVEPDSAVGAHLLTSSTSLQGDYRQLSSFSTPMAGLITELIELQIDLLIMRLELLLQGFNYNRFFKAFCLLKSGHEFASLCNTLPSSPQFLDLICKV
ncbi:hypothetical protein Peur_011461 [Populus x canadensis]